MATNNVVIMNSRIIRDGNSGIIGQLRENHSGSAGSGAKVA